MTQVAAHLEITASKVKGALQRTATQIAARGGPGGSVIPTRAAVEARRLAFAAERDAGKSMAEIARDHGTSRQAVFLVLKALRADQGDSSNVS